MDASFSIVSTARRQLILRVLWDGERRAGEIAEAMPDITFGAVSQHLGVLADAGLVQRRREGRERYYCVDRRALGAWAEWLESMWDSALADLKLRAEAEERRRGPKPRSKRSKR